VTDTSREESAFPAFGRAVEPVDDLGRYYHVRCAPGDLAPTVLLPGDPGRVARISRHWTEAREVASVRHYTVHTGRLGEVPVSAVSTGTGNPSMAIVVEEVARLGARTLIRVGTCGAIAPGVALGDVVITTGALRLDGTSRAYVDPGYPALASCEVVLALIEAAASLHVPYHVGITASTDAWYVGQGRPGFGGYLPAAARGLLDDLRASRVLNVEMDSSALLVLAGLYGLRAGAVCAVYAQRIEDRFAMVGEDRAIAVANRAVEILHRMDRQKARAGASHWHPGLRA
jgi:uridine phosphorylase